MELCGAMKFLALFLVALFQVKCHSSWPGGGVFQGVSYRWGGVPDGRPRVSGSRLVESLVEQAAVEFGIRVRESDKLGNGHKVWLSQDSRLLFRTYPSQRPKTAVSNDSAAHHFSLLGVSYRQIVSSTMLISLGCAKILSRAYYLVQCLL